MIFVTKSALLKMVYICLCYIFPVTMKDLLKASTEEISLAKLLVLPFQTKGTTDTLASVSGEVGNAVLQTKAPGEDMSTMENSRGSMQVRFATFCFKLIYILSSFKGEFEVPLLYTFHNTTLDTEIYYLTQCVRTGF